MRAIITTSVFVTLAAIALSLIEATASPTRVEVAGDLDEPISAYAAAAIDNNYPAENNDDVPPVENNAPPPPEVFGEPIPGKALLFVLDTSCSMASSNALGRLKSELYAAIDALVANNEALQQLWIAAGRHGDRPKVEFAMIRFSSSATHWQTSVVEATPSSGAAGKAWVSALYASGSTSWSRALDTAKSFGSAFDTVFFQSDGMPNAYNPWQPASNKLAKAYKNRPDPMRFIAQYFRTNGTSGQTEMRKLANHMDAKPNVTGVFSSVG